MKKVIVAHPGRQHSFRLASSLKNEGLLFKYITTVYDKDSSWIMKIIKKLISNDDKKRASSRKCSDLRDEDVIQFFELSGLIQLLLLRLDKNKILHDWLTKHLFDNFGKKVANFAIKNDVDAVIMYDTNSEACFRILEAKAPYIKRIMDVSAANLIYMKHIYEEDMNKNNGFAHKLYQERKQLWETDLEHVQNELNLTQHFLVPSTFVKKSLVYSGIPENKIKICPYGSNFIVENFDKSNNSNSLKLLFVGNVTQMKGISYLFDAIKDYNENEVSLAILGDYDNESGVFDEYLDKYNFFGRVSHDVVKEMCYESDIFVFPSLGEGMSLAALEAMSCGLPLICSINSGVNDLITEGENGFVVPVGDSEAIREKIQWFIENKDKIQVMSKNASKTAKKYTWEAYKIKVSSIVNEIVND